jgi:hypothetical protein
MRRGRLLVVGVLVCAAGTSSAALAGPDDDYRAIKRDWARDQRITPCRWTVAQLENARGRLTYDDGYSDFPEAVRAEIRRQRSGHPCPGARLAPGAPVLDRVRLTRTTFRVGSGTTAVAARAPVGTALRWRVSKRARVRVVVDRAASRGRWRVAGALRRDVDAGPGGLTFTGRIGSRALAPGAYRARVVAVDADGLRSRERALPFTVAR